MPRYPFEAPVSELESHIEEFVDSFIGSLQSFFLVMPKGSAFVAFPRFQQAYLQLASRTGNFASLSSDAVLSALAQDPLILLVLRTILGFSPPELAHVATARTGVTVDQSSARRLDKRAREGLPLLSRTSKKTQEQVKALVVAAVNLITEGAPAPTQAVVHRLEKADTSDGLAGVRRLSTSGVAYEVLLYERLLGRPFATHRDAVSEEVGDILENALESALNSRHVQHYKSGVGERFEDMDQGPDFFVPNQLAPKVLIEAKLAEDDGTARDKVTRVQHLAELRDQRLRNGAGSFEVVACVDGRGFSVRRENVRKLLLATKGKVFTLQTVDRIVDNTPLAAFAK